MQPMLATRGDHIPSGSEWIHEVKWDGMRVLVEVRRGQVRAFSRNENDVTVSFPELHGLGEVIDDALLDGEVVALRSGAPSFSDLAERMHVRDARRASLLAESNPVTLVVFDLLALDGQSLLEQPLTERRDRLESLGLDDPAWLVPPAYDDGDLIHAAAEQQGLEGIVSKRRTSRYRPGQRSKDWLKFPIRPTGSYVIGGYRPEKGSDRLGSVLVGTPTADGLSYRGRVGSGIAGRAGRMLAQQLSDRPDSPFADEVPRVDREGTVWVDPVLVIDVEYLALTGDRRLRQPSYRGVRVDLTSADLMQPTEDEPDGDR